MKVYIQPSQAKLEELLERPSIETAQLENTVGEIIKQVDEQGDEALKALTLKFDKVNLSQLAVSKAEIEAAADQLEEPLKEAIRIAKENIEKFHKLQKQAPLVVETMPGVKCWQKSVPIQKVGLYIPGGTAPLFSTVLMVGVPAKVAGCSQLVLCTPPRKDGSIDPAILFTAQLLGVDEIFKIGGAQAIAAMALGTVSVPKVYKIFGPGNQYVTAAKQMVNRQGTAIDMPAGPSEVLVLADETAKPAFVAADLLSQAEHGADSQVVLLAFSEITAMAILEEVNIQLKDLPRKEMAAAALENSLAIIIENREQAVEVINTYAPEHLILAVESPAELAESIFNAGSVFLGHYTPESVGDYASGTNHVLPTNGFAKAYSGLNLDAFVKKITFQELSPEGLMNLGPSVEKMAAAEQLQAHKNAVSVRLKSLKP